MLKRAGLAAALKPAGSREAMRFESVRHPPHLEGETNRVGHCLENRWSPHGLAFRLRRLPPSWRVKRPGCRTRPETVGCPNGHGFRVVRSPPLWVDRRRGGWSPKPTLLGSSPSRPANLFRRGLLASRPSSELARTVVRFHPPEPFRSAVAVQVLHLAFDSRHCWFESNPLNQFDYVHQANPTESASQVGTCTNYLVSDLSAAPPRTRARFRARFSATSLV